MPTRKNIFAALIFGIIFALSCPSLALAYGDLQEGEKSPQELHDEFIDYSREYFDEAEKYSKKARKSKGDERRDLLKVSDLSRKMGNVKKKMAKAYLKEDYKEAERQEKEYYKLSDKREKVWEKLKGH